MCWRRRNSSNSDVIDYITINTNGNATDFGDLTLARNWITGTSSSTKEGLFGGGRTHKSKYHRLYNYWFNR